MTTAGLPTVWELVAEGAATLPEPFSRAALVNWVSARLPDVGVASIAAHIQYATANAVSSGNNPFAGREPLLHRLGHGQYLRYRTADDDAGARGAVVRSGRVALIGSSGAVAGATGAAGRLFLSDGFARAREHAVRLRLPWFVLSAKHGLLDPDEAVTPFAMQIDDQPAAYRSAWGEWVVAQLADRVRLDGVVVEVHGGVDFAQPLRQPLARLGAVLEIPLPGTWMQSQAPSRNDHTEPSVRAFDRLRGFVGLGGPSSADESGRASAS